MKFISTIQDQLRHAHLSIALIKLLPRAQFSTWHSIKSWRALPFMLCLYFFGYTQQPEYVSVRRNMRLMGALFEITVVTPNEEIGYINIEEAASEVKRIEHLISTWEPESETSRINAMAGKSPVKVSPELFNLIRRSLQLSELTNGAFDITYASYDSLWNFTAGEAFLPSPEVVADVRKNTGYKNVVLDEASQTVFLKNLGMKIDLGGIGKGYAVDKAKALLMSRQVHGGMINFDGDITTWGSRATGEKWLLGIANPLANSNLITWIPILESSVSISGSRQQYLMVGGKKYSNIIDPRTGYPLEAIRKVTVLAKMAEFCDALATAIGVLGIREGLSLADQLGDTEVIIEEENGTLYHSKGLMLDKP